MEPTIQQLPKSTHTLVVSYLGYTMRDRRYWFAVADRAGPGGVAGVRHRD